ncbi:MAG: NADP-dependent oxidoreductase [Microbacterium sp.]|nr:NADP-dependent oxidoreductase [Microbacterium sp.]
MTHGTSTQIRLARRPQGWPTPDDFSIERVELSKPAPGEVRVANEFVSVDPYMRGRMNDVRSYVPPYALGDVIAGGAIGRVVASASDDLPVGAVVLHQHGWSDVVQADASTFRAVPEVPGLPLSVRLHILGMTGLTAYVGLTAIAHMKPGDTVFVSGAAGAVGSAPPSVRSPSCSERAGSSARPALRRRSRCSPRSTATTQPSTTRTRPSASSSPRTPPTASTCSSTTWAATISRPRSTS